MGDYDRVSERILRRFLVRLSAGSASRDTGDSCMVSLEQRLRAVKGVCDCRELRRLFVGASVPPRMGTRFEICSSSRVGQLGTRVARVSMRVTEYLLVRRVLKAEVSSALALEPSYLAERGNRSVVRVCRIGAGECGGPVDGRLTGLLRDSVRCARRGFNSARCVFIGRGRPSHPVRCVTVGAGIVSVVRRGRLGSSRNRLFKFKARVFQRCCNIGLARVRLSS